MIRVALLFIFALVSVEAAPSLVVSNLTVGGALHVTGGITNAALTPSRLLLSSAAKSLASASVGLDIASPSAGQVLSFHSASILTNTAAGAGLGDVVGPGSATDNAITRFDSTTGKLVQNSGVTVSDANNVVTVGGLHVTEAITNIALTASRAIVTSADKALASSAVTSTELGYVSGATSALQAQINAKGTNYPNVVSIGTNITVGLGVRQSVALATNASFQFVFTGTPLNGESIQFAVSNLSAATIYATNTSGIYDPTVASNVTTFAVSASSVRFFEFVNQTNFNLGASRWELRNTLQKEFEISAGSGITFTTNGGVITINGNTSSVHTFTDSVAATNSSANTNITIDMSVRTTRLALTNNATFTNWIGNTATTSGGFALIIQPQLVNRTVVWPALSTPVWGLYFRTNSGSTLWTTLTNGVEYWLTGDRHDTNVVLTLSAFK